MVERQFPGQSKLQCDDPDGEGYLSRREFERVSVKIDGYEAALKLLPREALLVLYDQELQRATVSQVEAERLKTQRANCELPADAAEARFWSKMKD